MREEHDFVPMRRGVEGRGSAISREKRWICGLPVRLFILSLLLAVLVGCSDQDSSSTEHFGTSSLELTLAQPVRIRLTRIEFGAQPATPRPREWAIGFNTDNTNPIESGHSGSIFECTEGVDCTDGGNVHSFSPGSFDPNDPRFFEESYEYIFQMDAARATNTLFVTAIATPPHEVPGPTGESLTFTLTINSAGAITGHGGASSNIAALDNECVTAKSGWKLCWQSDLPNMNSTPRAEFRLASILLDPGSPSSQSTFRWTFHEGPPGRFVNAPSKPPLARRRAGGPYLRCTPGGNCNLNALGVQGTNLVSLAPEDIPNGDGRFFPLSNKFILPMPPGGPVEFWFDMTEFDANIDIVSTVSFSFKIGQDGVAFDLAVFDDIIPGAPRDWTISTTLPVPVTGNFGQYCLGSATRKLTLCFDVGGVALGSFQPPPGGARWLRAAQYQRTITDMLGTEAGALAKALPDPVVPVASEEAFTASVDAFAATQYESNAIAIARQAVQTPTKLATHAPCVTQGPTDAAFRQMCYLEVAERLGYVAFKLPPLDDAKQRLVSIALLGEEGIAGDSDKLKSGLTYEIATILESPSFLYSIEIGAPSAAQGVNDLNAFEIASRLSLFLLGRAPSEELLDRAAKGELSTPAGIRSVANNMLSSPEARDGFFDQIDELFQVKLISTKGKDPGVYPTFSEQLGKDMREEVQRFVWDIALANPRDFLTVLTDQRRFINADLAQNVYHIAPPANDWDAVDFSAAPLNAQKRTGVMTMPAMMTILSHNVRNSIVRRGLFANEHLFCQTELHVPRMVDTVLHVADNGTLREFMEQVEAAPNCNPCHKYMNRLGYAFENFDAIGQFRTEEIDKQGGHHAINASSTGVILLDQSVFGDYNDAVDWANDAANLGHLVSRCWVDQMYRNAVGQKAGGGQDRALASIDAAFGQSGQHLVRDLLLSFVSGQAFTQVGPGR